MKLFSLIILFPAALAPISCQGFSKYNRPWGFGDAARESQQMGQTKAFPDEGKDFLFSDDWREDIARLEARLAQLEEDLNQRYHPQRHFNNVGFQNYGAPPRRGLVQLNRNPSNPLMENQFRMMRNYDNSPFDDFLSQQSSNIYGRRMGEPPQNPLRQHPSIPLPNPANLVKKPSSNDKKQRSQLSSSSLSQPIPLPNPPSISQPIATDPKPQDTDELSFMRSSKPNANQQ